MRRIKRVKWALAVMLIIILIIPQGVFAATAGPGGKSAARTDSPGTAAQQKARFRQGEVIFKAKAGASEAGILKKYKLNKLRRDEKLGYILASAGGVDVQKLVGEMQKDRAVDYAQPNQIYQLLGKPSDPQYSRQWAMPKINAEQGWTAAKANSPVTVAILDSGVDINHPDLKPRLVPGMNTVNPLKSTRDDEGHGTHVAGIVGAVNNNGIGVTGVAGAAGIKIMPVKVFDEWGASDVSISDGIIWATDHGAKVMNMSFGSYFRSKVLADAIDYAYGKGVVMIAAAGNWASEEISYPAALSKVIAVSATDKNDKLADFSSYGPQIDVCAPGDEIYSTFWDPYKGSTYTELSGTSMASPMVAGLAALMLAKNPKLTNDEVRQIIEASATDLGDPGWDPKFGHGRINVYKALTLSLAKIDDGNGDMKKAVKISSGTPLKEKINYGSDEDWFKVTVPDKTHLQVEVLPAGKVSPGVEIYDSAGSVLASFNTTEKEQEQNYEDFWYYEGPRQSIKVAEAVYGLVHDLDGGDYYIKVFGNHFRWSDEPYTVTARAFADSDLVTDPNEPNDSYEEAKKIEVGSEVKGAFLDEDDEDWFKVNLSGGAYKVSVDVPEGLDLAVDVESEANYQKPASDAEWEYYDERWYSKTVNNAGQGKDEEGVIVLPENGGGNYFIRVYDTAGNAVNDNYTLKISPFDFRPDKYEVNDAWNQGSLINLGEEISANFHKEDDEDWYVIDVQNTGILKVTFKQPPGTWCNLQLYDDPEGEPIGEGYFAYRYRFNRDYYDYYYPGDDENKEQTFEFKVTRKKYYIRIYNYGDLSAENYIMKTEFTPFDYVDFEVNDTPLRANDIKPGESKKGTLFPDGDLDFYVIEIEKPQPYLVYLTPPKDLNTQIAVFKESQPEEPKDKKDGDKGNDEGGYGEYPPGYEEEPAGPQEPDLDLLTEIDSGEKGQPDTGVFVANKPGRYYVLLGAVSEQVDGKRLAKSEGLYTLSIKPFKVQPDAWESNNNMAKARVITSGAAIKPTFMGTEDQDWYKVSVPGKGTLAVSMAVPNDIDGVVEIYDPTGKLVAKIDQSMVGEEESGSVAVSKPGYYYIRTYDYLGNSSVQPYTLTVKFNPSAAKSR